MNFITRKLKKTQQLFTSIFQDSAFFMQGQMDIHPESRWYNEDLVRRTGGFFPKGDQQHRAIKQLEPWDNTRRDMISLLLRTICENNIRGEFAELGVYRGSTAALIHHYAPERQLHLFDTFEGFPEESMKADEENAGNVITKKLFTDTSAKRVADRIDAQNDHVSFHKGYFPQSIPQGFEEKKFAFVHLDADLYEPILEGLKFFYDRMTPGGFILIHDYNSWIGSRQATDEFFEKKKEKPIPMPDKSGSALIQFR